MHGSVSGRGHTGLSAVHANGCNSFLIGLGSSQADEEQEAGFDGDDEDVVADVVDDLLASPGAEQGGGSER